MYICVGHAHLGRHDLWVHWQAVWSVRILPCYIAGLRSNLRNMGQLSTSYLIVPFALQPFECRPTWGEPEAWSFRLERADGPSMHQQRANLSAPRLNTTPLRASPELGPSLPSPFIPPPAPLQHALDSRAPWLCRIYTSGPTRPSRALLSIADAINNFDPSQSLCSIRMHVTAQGTQNSSMLYQSQ